MSRRASKKPEYDFPEAELRPEYLLKEQMEKFRMTDAELREVYIRLRELRGRSFSSPEELAAAAGQPVERLFTALMAFGETGLLSWRLNPFSVVLTEHPARCRMTDSPLIRYLRAGTKA